jgi:hypothetical protein
LKRHATLLLLGLFSILSLVACLADRGPDPCNEEGTLLNDDFEGEKVCGWVLYEGRGVSSRLEEGVLRLSNSLSGEIAWANAGKEFDDLIIDVDTYQAGGPDDNAYGVICRYQNPQNFYVFLISGDGHYAIGKYQSGSSQVQYLSGEGQYVYSDVINQGQSKNQMRVSCVGNELSLTVNGVPLETVTDPTFVIGDIGLGASTFQPGTAVIEFDNLRVIAP